MTQNEIIEMARQAGLSVENPQYGYTERHHVAGWITDIEAFTKLVEDKVRQEIIEKNAPVIKKVNEHIKELQNAVKAEREACAELAENCDPRANHRGIASAIRARGNT